MVLISSSVNSIDPYLYKLILSISLSNLGLGATLFRHESGSMFTTTLSGGQRGKEQTVFEVLVMESMPSFESFYLSRTGKESSNVVEIFDCFLSEVFSENVDQIKHRFALDLFRIPFGSIIKQFLATPNMDLKLKEFLTLRIKNSEVGDADWQIIKNELISFCVTTVPLDINKYGAGSNLIGIIRQAVTFFVGQRSSFIFRVLNQFGMNAVINEDGLTMGHFNTVSISENLKDLDFQGVLADIYNMNSAMYNHSFHNIGKIMFYDVISKYKFDQLKDIADEIDLLFKEAYHTNTLSQVLAFDKNSMTSVTSNSGTVLKFNHNDSLLDMLRPIILNGIDASEVADYVRDIFYHTLHTLSSSASSVINLSSVPSGEGEFGTAYTYSNSKSQDTLQSLIIGSISINKLLRHISSLGYTIFDLNSSLFRDIRYTYRFRNFEEYYRLFPIVYDLLNRTESNEELSFASRNGLPLNDDLLKISATGGGPTFSINCADISNILTEVKDFNRDRPARNADSHGVKLDSINNNIQQCVKSAIHYNTNLGNFSVNIVKFCNNISKNFDLVSAFDVDAFKSGNIPYALEQSEDTFYINPPLKLIEYCGNSTALCQFVSKFTNANVSNPEALKSLSGDYALSVYRSCSFFILLLSKINEFSTKLSNFLYNHIMVNNKSVGVFDIFAIISKNLVLFNLPSMNDLAAVKTIRDNYTLNLYKTSNISLESVDQDLLIGYRIFLKFFSPIMSSLEELMAMYYHGFSNKLSGSNVAFNSEASMKKIAESLSREGRITLSSFLKFKSFCDHSTTGFLMLKGRFVYFEKKGYLFDRGYWVNFGSDNSVRILPVTESDNFEQELGGMI